MELQHHPDILRCGIFLGRIRNRKNVRWLGEIEAASGRACGNDFRQQPYFSVIPGLFSITLCRNFCLLSDQGGDSISRSHL
jgi:hypothetical protein